MNKGKKTKNLWFLPAATFLILVLASAGIIVFKNSQAPVNESANGSKFKYECDESNPESIDCQQKKYADTVKSKDVSEAFVLLREEYQNKPSVQASCHQITHAIGREAAAIYKTIESSYDQGDSFCWSGYYHGVMEAIAADIGTEKINATLTDICANVAATRQYSFYHFNCVHGLGHGLMSVNQDELFDVLELCDKYSDNWEQRSCYGGAFMENIMISIQMGGYSKYLKSDEPMYPCTAVDDRYKQECYLMQTSQALRVVNNDYAKVFSLCSETGNYANVCYQSLGRDASGNSTSNKDSTISVCMLGQSMEARENCFVGAVKDFISYFHGDSEASELCSSLEIGLRESCHRTRQEYIKTL